MNWPSTGMGCFKEERSTWTEYPWWRSVPLTKEMCSDMTSGPTMKELTTGIHMTVRLQVLSVLEQDTMTVRIAGPECFRTRYYDGENRRSWVFRNKVLWRWGSQVLSVLEQGTMAVRIAGLECSGTMYYDGEDRRSWVLRNKVLWR